MDIDFWHKRWAGNNIGFHRAQYNELLRQFWGELGLPAGSTVFVPLSGKSLDLLWLSRQGYRVIASEVSDIAVRAFFSENDLPYTLREESEFSVWTTEKISIYCGDFFALKHEHLGPVDAVYDRAALIAMPAQMRQAYFRHLNQLTGKAAILLVTLAYPQAEMEGPPFSVPEDEVRSLSARHYGVRKLYDEDILRLEENERFLQRGLTAMSEMVFLLQPGANSSS